ncbi:MAG: hypothetical protein WCA35_14565 [Kovacikia sp.]
MSSTATGFQYQVWLGGSLANHRRGRILKATVKAQPSQEVPDKNGICLLFGSDYQEATEAAQRAWLTWSQEPGRVLLLLPPFKSMECKLPVEWKAQRRQTLVSSKEHAFLDALAPEVQYELEGQLQIAQSIGGTWDDQSLCTVYYRKHPHSGVFAITCLPLWSLVVLDWVPALQEWLGNLSELGPAISVESQPSSEPAFLPSPEHFTVLLHLLTAHFDSAKDALEALQNSPIFSLDPTQAAQCLQELQTQGLVSEAHPTNFGRQTLLESPYAPYAKELEALIR